VKILRNSEMPTIFLRTRAAAEAGHSVGLQTGKHAVELGQRARRLTPNLIQ